MVCHIDNRSHDDFYLVSYNILSYSGSSPIMPYLFLCLLFADAKTEFQSCYSLLKTDPQFLTGFYYPLSNSIFFTVLILLSRILSGTKPCHTPPN